MDDKDIDDIVSMIDQFVAGNGGHMNIKVNPDGVVETEKTCSKTVTQMNSSDCGQGDMACKVPTLFEGMDFADDSDFTIDN